MNQTFCVALVFSVKSYRYRAYARQYTEVLLSLQKSVVIVSPDCLELQEDLLVKFKNYNDKLTFVPFSADEIKGNYPSKFELIKRYFRLGRYLSVAEKNSQTKIDLVFFAPIEDWVRPKFKKWIFRKIFPYKFSGLLTITKQYEDGGLKLNVDPKYHESDYLMSIDSCIGVCTLDRFNTEKIRSRVYKKVILLPDVTDFELQVSNFELGQQIRKMANGRMLIGAILIDTKFPFDLIESIISAPLDLYFFAIIGEISTDLFDEAQKQKLKELLESEKLNYFIKTDFTLTKEKLNSLIKSFDVVYIQSNFEELPSVLLTKAVKFEKPVISYKTGHTSKLVFTFKLGLVVGQEYYTQLEALQVLRLQIPFNLNYNFGPSKTYLKLQSRDYLRRAWEELLWF